MQVTNAVMRRSERVWKFSRLFWFGLCVLVLVMTMYGGSSPENRDIDIVMVWLMLVLSFPSGYVVSVLYFAVALLSPRQEFPPVSNVYLGLLLTWLGFFVAGYLQWFVLVPAAIRKIRQRLHRSSAAPPAPPSS